MPNFGTWSTIRDMETQEVEYVSSDEVATSVVRTLIANRGLMPQAAALAVGIKRSRFYSRLQQGGWSFEEIAAIADFFNAPLEWFVQGIPGLEPAGLRARRDSNPQPSDPQIEGRTLAIVPSIPGQRKPANASSMDRPLLTLVASN